MKTAITIEVCVENRAGAHAALEAGAQRVELCAGLDLGGLTPSAGSIESVLELGIETVVLIRPRAGDFVYDADEVRVMRRDMQAAWTQGVRSFAIGALKPDGSIDHPAMRELVEVGHGTPSDPGTLCFHRAFDGTRDPLAALQALAALGFHRLLTSGQRQNALAGAQLIRELVQTAPPSLAIMPGGGVRPHTIRKILESTGAQNIHFSARTPIPGAMQHTNPNCDLHNQQRCETSATEIQRYLDSI